MSSTRKFNWKGISENNDGSFNVEDKRARRRLLKELHGQGFKVRSKKIEGDGYQLTPIGQGNFKASKTSAPVRSAARPRMAYTSYRRLPHRTGTSGPRLVPYPTRSRSFSRPYYGAPPRVSGVSGPGLRLKVKPVVSNYIKERLKRRNERIQEEQKPRFREVDEKTGKVRFVPQGEHEINEKMRKERYAQEKAERHKEFSAESKRAREERKQGESLKQAAANFEHNRSQHIKSERHAEFHATRGEIRDYRQEEEFRDTHTRKQEPKPDNSKLAEARQEYITGS